MAGKVDNLTAGGVCMIISTQVQDGRESMRVRRWGVTPVGPTVADDSGRVALGGAVNARGHAPLATDRGQTPPAVHSCTTLPKNHAAQIAAFAN